MSRFESVVPHTCLIPGHHVEVLGAVLHVHVVGESSLLQQLVLTVYDDDNLLEEGDQATVTPEVTLVSQLFKSSSRLH